MIASSTRAPIAIAIPPRERWTSLAPATLGLAWIFRQSGRDTEAIGQHRKVTRMTVNNAEGA